MLVAAYLGMAMAVALFRCVATDIGEYRGALLRVRQFRCQAGGCGSGQQATAVSKETAPTHVHA